MIYNDIKELNSYAQKQGWSFGAPIHEYTLPEISKIESISYNSYDDLFKNWKWQISDENLDRRKHLWGYYWAFHYIWMIDSLVKGKKDGQEIDLEEISADNLRNLGFSYPTQGSELQHIYEGLKFRFGYIIPRDHNGNRLFITGIGRQSGYFYEKYTNKFDQNIFPKFNRNYDEVINRQHELKEHIVNFIPESQIMRDSKNKLDYHTIADFYVQLSQANKLGIFNLDHLDQLSDLFALPISVTERILKVLKKDAVLNKSSISLSFSDNGLFYNLLNKLDFSAFGLRDQDAFLKLEEHEGLISYSFSGGVWKGISQKVKVGSKPELSLKYKEQQTVKVLDITPVDLLESPLIIFNEKKLFQPSAVGRLREGRTYYIVKNPALWSVGYSLNFLNADGTENRELFNSPIKFTSDHDIDALQVKDSDGGIVFALSIKRKNSLSPKFSDYSLCPYVKGKRTFYRFPEIEEDDVESYDTLNLYKGEKSLINLNNVNLPLSLDNKIDGHEFGDFLLELSAGERKVKRQLTILPYDFELSPNIDKSHGLNKEVELYFSSQNLLPDGREDITVTKDESHFSIQLDFGFKKLVNFSGEIKRTGAYIQLDEEVVYFADSKNDSPAVNLDNLTHSGVLNAFAPVGSAVGVRLHGYDKKESPDYFKKVDRYGKISVSLPEIRRSCNSAVWENCQYISLLIYSPEGLVRNGGIIPTESFSKNKFKELKLDSFGTLTVKKDVCQTLRLRDQRPEYQHTKGSFKSIDFSKCFDEGLEGDHSEIGLVLVPLEAQDKVPLLLLRNSKLYSGSDFKVLEADMSLESSANLIELKVRNFAKLHSQGAGNIAFLVELKKGQLNRLSRGGFIAGEDKRDGRIIAFPDLIADAEVEARFKECSSSTSDFIDGLFKNADSLEAHHYFSLISALNPRELSGYVFRAVNYWMRSLVQIWVIKFLASHVEESSSPEYRKVQLIDQYWNRQLFAYDDVKDCVEDMCILSEEALTSHLVNIMTSPNRNFSSWEVIIAMIKYPHLKAQISVLTNHLKTVYEKCFESDIDNQLLEQMLKYAQLEDRSIQDYSALRHFWTEYTPGWLSVSDNKMSKSYLHYLAWEVNRWRKSPSISIHSNIIRNQLQFLAENYQDLYSYLNILLVEIFIKESV